MSEVSSATLALLTLSMLKGVGPATLKKATALPGFADMPIEELATFLGVIDKALAEPDAWILAQKAAATQVDEARRHQARILSAVDAEYPLLLSSTKDDPFILFVKGTLAYPSEQSVAVIGTREPTTHGKLIAKRITEFFVEQNWSIVSGLATGCDAVAHQAALDAGGHTVAVLAHGLQMIAPTKHKRLAAEILASGGALVSEYPFGQTVRPQQYVKRDRTQAGLAQGVVMIQSDIKGGSLYASRASLDYGRWLAVPYPTDKDRHNGAPKVQANLLIADGTDEARTDLLRCSLTKLKKIIVLHSRQDYFQLIASVDKGVHSILTEQRPQQSDDSQPVLSESTMLKPFDSRRVGNATEMSEGAMPDSLKEKGISTNSRTFESVRQPAPHWIVLDQKRVSDLAIKQITAEGSDDFAQIVSQVQDVDLLEVLSARLRFIQTQLDLLTSLYADSPTIADKERRLKIQFVVENTLMQMRRAIDLLNELSKVPYGSSDDLFAVRNRGRLDAPEQFELGYPAMPQQDTYFLLELLDEHLGTLSRPIKLVDDETRNHCLSEDTDLRFDELVTALNTLIEKILHV